MTLIAAFEVEGQAALIGDLLLTQSGKWGNPPATLPSRVDQYRPKQEFTVAGLYRKIVIIGDHCALAWSCNDVRTASAVIDAIKTLERTGQLSWNSISEAIVANKDAVRDRLALIIQRFDGEKLVTGTYKAISPASDDFNKFSHVSVAGSGFNAFLDLLDIVDAAPFLEFATRSEAHIPSPEEVQLAHWQATCSTMLGLLTMSEHTQGEEAHSLANRYGGGYELAFFDGVRFRHFSDYSMQLWTVQVEEGRKVRGSIVPRLITSTHYLLDHLVVKATKITGGPNEEIHSDTINFIVAPHGSEAFEGDLSMFDQMPTSINLVTHVVFVHYREESRVCFLNEWVQSGQQPRSSLQVVDGKLGFMVHPTC